MNGIGVETGFKASAVFKGDAKIQRLVLHHYRNAAPDPVANGPIFVKFGPSDSSSYLLFLILEPDGRYAPTSGQTDPGFTAITRLQSPDPGYR
jgi:hypothetical protein